jgi:hypothetical protein
MRPSPWLLDRPVKPGDDRHGNVASRIPCQRNSLLQGIWQRNFSGSRVKGTIPAGLAQLRQRVAANSLRLRGREFARPAQGNVSMLAGNPQGRAGNRRQRRNPDANVSCRSFFGRSFVDGANFDGTIDKMPELT